MAAWSPLAELSNLSDHAAIRNLFRRFIEVLAGASESDLRQQVQFLKAENEILRSRIPGRVLTTARERARLVKLGQPLGAAIQAIITVVAPKTFQEWVRRAEGRPKRPGRTAGRPRTPEEIRDIILRIARETGWGYTRILGELKKLGIRICRGTVINILKEAKLPTGPQRGESTWADFVSAHAQTLWACDFLQRRILTVTGWKDAYVLLFVNLATRQAFATSSTHHPVAAWVKQKVQEFQAATGQEETTCRVLTRDRDKKYGPPFDEALVGCGILPVQLPYRSPNLNAHVERFIQTLQIECLDKFIVMGTGHLDHLVSEFIEHYNEERPHSSIGYRAPTGPPALLRLTLDHRDIGPVRCETRLGGVLRHYQRIAG